MTRDERAILDLLDSAPPDVPAYLATVVDVVGSAYRRPGAKLLLTADGRQAGAISGGCLERDLARRAPHLTRGGPRTVCYDTRGDDEQPAGAFNTGCDGVITLLIERVHRDAPAIVALRQKPGTRLTAFAADATAPLRVGERCCPCDDRLPAEVGEHVQSTPDASSTRTLRATSRSGWSVQMLVERVAPPRRLYLFGDGDDVQPLIDFAHILKWESAIISRRRPSEVRRLFPAADAVAGWRRGDPASVPKPTARDAAVLATHSYADDRLLVPALLASDAPYVGLLGPKRRVARLMRELHEAGELPPPRRLATLRTPAGLDLGGEDATAVALSIVSEIQAVFHDRPSGPLRDRSGSVHAPHVREEVEVA